MSRARLWAGLPRLIRDRPWVLSGFDSEPQKTARTSRQHDLSRADLVPLLGTPSRVSEVLGGKRDLSMTMVRRLRERCWNYGDDAASGNVKLLGLFAS